MPNANTEAEAAAGWTLGSGVGVDGVVAQFTITITIQNEDRGPGWSWPVARVRGMSKITKGPLFASSVHMAT